MNNLLINLPYDNNKTFHVCALLRYLIKVGRTYIIQGQQHVTLKSHTKPNSLDYWIRNNVANNKDTAQATNEVINQLANTGIFETDNHLECPDSKNHCNGIKIKNV